MTDKKYCKHKTCYGWKDYKCIKCGGWIVFEGFDPSVDKEPKALEDHNHCIVCERTLAEEVGHDNFRYCANRFCARYRLLVSYNSGPVIERVSHSNLTEV